MLEEYPSYSSQEYRQNLNQKPFIKDIYKTKYHQGWYWQAKKGDLASRVKKLLTPGTVLERPALLGERKEASCLSGPAWLTGVRCLYHVQLCSHTINWVCAQYFSSQVIVERASRDDAGMYECWDISGEAASKTKQVQLFPLMTKTKKIPSEMEVALRYTLLTLLFTYCPNCLRLLKQ